MRLFPEILKPIVAAVLIAVSANLVQAQDKLDQLFESLAVADAAEAEKIAAEIELAWTQSGSASADFLLKRGRDALEVGEVTAAIDHFSALIDHAPDFAEGYANRASAFAYQGYYGLAVADLENVLARNPRHFHAIYGLGTILERIDKPKAAMEAYELLRSIHPHHPELTEALERVSALVQGQSL